MRIISKPDQIIEFMNYVSTKKRELGNWRYLHAAFNPFEEKISADEIVQLMGFHFPDNETWILVPPNSGEVLMFTHKNNTIALNRLEKAISENFKSNTLRVRTKNFELDGLEQFSKIMSPYIDKNNIPMQVSFTRMGRLGNTVLVLDDDMLVLKQMERVLSGLGHVVTMRNTIGFRDNYIQYAPNILFLDIHLEQAKGNEILKDLTSQVDPYAHVVMISADTQEEMVKDIKVGGAKGFVVKPLNIDNLFKHAMKSPTMNMRTGAT